MSMQQNTRVLGRTLGECRFRQFEDGVVIVVAFGFHSQVGGSRHGQRDRKRLRHYRVVHDEGAQRSELLGEALDLVALGGGSDDEVMGDLGSGRRYAQGQGETVLLGGAAPYDERAGTLAGQQVQRHVPGKVLVVPRLAAQPLVLGFPLQIALNRGRLRETLGH